MERYDAFVAAAAGAVVGLDMDGTLSPIVDDPTRAHIHPDAADVLVDLADAVGAVAVITGRPAAQAIELGRLDEVGRRVRERGRTLHLFGQYGNERWSSAATAITRPEPPPGLSALAEDLPRLLRDADAEAAYVEDKGLALAVHTRRLADPDAALARLREPLAEAAARHGLTVEPGRRVLELRAPGMSKGDAVRTIAAETRATAFLFAGDDLGDLEAFRAVLALGSEGLATYLVCSASGEENALAEHADEVVDGPDGVMAFLRRLTRDADEVSSRRPR